MEIASEVARFSPSPVPMTALLGDKLQLDRLIKMIPGHVYVKDENSVYQYCNELQAKSFGLDKPEDVVGKPEIDVIPSEIAERIRANDVRIMKNRLGESLTEDFIDERGRWRIMESHKVPLINAAGSVKGILGISYDVTERVEHEELTKKVEVAAMANRQLEILAGSIAHELRTPLMTVMLHINLLSKNFDKLTAGYQKAVDNNLVEDNIDAPILNHLINANGVSKRVIEGLFQLIDILLLNLRNNKKMAAGHASLSVREWLEESVESYVYSEGQRAQVSLHVPEDIKIKGDVKLLKHIIYNLLKNSFHAIKAAGKGSISITTQTERKTLKVKIRDTAKGISPNKLKNIFDRFVTHEDGGTGLGLAFCKEMMLLHGGNINCTSEIGEYTEFTLEFPRV